MLYNLLVPFADKFTLFNVFRYLTFRTAGAVITALGDRLARYKQPKRVFFVDELPRNTMGKVQKNLLRERYAATFAA